MDFNVDNWIIDRRIISGNEGSCNAWKTTKDWVEHTDGSKEQGDYLVCGYNDDDGSPCRYISPEIWNQIWDNCHGKADEDQDETGDDGENWDTCWNMVTGNAGTSALGSISLVTNNILSITGFENTTDLGLRASLVMATIAILIYFIYPSALINIVSSITF